MGTVGATDVTKGETVDVTTGAGFTKGETVDVTTGAVFTKG